MKFKDVKTLNHFLKEYGMTAGKPSYGSNATNSMPSVSKPQQKPEKSIAEPKKSNSPNTQEQPQKVLKFAHKFKKDDKFLTKQGELTVVSPIGMNSTSIGNDRDDVIIAVDDQGQPFAFDRNDKLEINQQLNDGKLSDLAKKGSSKIHLDQKSNKKFKRLIRKNKLREQGDELIFEINFNDPKLAKQALDFPIKCGFEAETSWNDIYGNGNDDDSDWLYDYNWYDIEDFIRDQEGSSSVNGLQESYDEWIVEGPALEMESDIIQDFVSERKEDEYYINKFIEDEIDEDDIEEYKERILDDLPEEDLDEYEDWDFMNWGRQYVEEELEDQFMQWLEEDIRDEGDAFTEAIDRAKDEYDLDYWASEEYGGWANCLYEHDIYLSNPDNNGGGDQEEVADRLRGWTSDNSNWSRADAGEYHSGYGDTDQDYWRVEDDSSIDSSGTGSEIISPVYETPRDMLKEMKSMFEWLEQEGVETNSSTGLHITMSVTEKDTSEVNAVKLAVLLGDKYLLSTFGRLGNSYAKSQYANLEKIGARLKANPDAKTIEQIEDILKSGISRDKFSSINFKDIKDKKTGSNLIEFRIGGGNDYHLDFNNVAKAVIRYAATLQASYNNNYQADYAKALYRLINNIGKISADQEQRVKDRINPDVEAPAVDVLKDYFSKENYIEHMRYLAAAYNTLIEYQTARDQTNEDESGPDTDRLQGLLNKAQQYFAGAIAQAGYDFNQGHNRATPNAKSIGILRYAMKDFELEYEKLSELLIDHVTQQKIDTGERGSFTQKQIMSRVKNGVDKLFKKSVLDEPNFLTQPQIEKLVSGMWNAVHSGELQDGQKSIQFIELCADASGSSTDEIGEWLDKAIREFSKEYKTFNRTVSQGAYSTPALFLPGNAIDEKAYKTFAKHLEQYPEWNHPVSKDHRHPGSNASGNDSYIDNSLSKMLIKMRDRWEHLEDMKEENPGVYIDSIREISKLVKNLISSVQASGDTMEKIYPELEGTDHEGRRDGNTYFGMPQRDVESLQSTIEQIDRPDPFEDPVTSRFRNTLQNYLRGSYDRYYEITSSKADTFGKDYYTGPLKDLLKKRTTAVKEFLSGFDKISQKIGFDSQSSEIANKKQLDTKQKKFKNKYGPDYSVKVDAFDFGGEIFITKDFADKADSYNPEELAEILNFSRRTLLSDSGQMALVPHAHYGPAYDAKEILENDRYANTWRATVAERILREFMHTYQVTFNDFLEKYENLNNRRSVKQNLIDKGVKFTKKLGDGRIGMGKFRPFMEPEEMVGPYGEPFSLSGAVSWRVNNPELAKKVDAKEKKRKKETQNVKELLKAAGVEDYESYSSSSIADNTSWGDLADYLELPRGVGDQGVNLLNRIYDKYDNDHNWRPEPDPDVCCAPRWAAAVKAAQAYIERNYIHSGGNYFRKNPDGSIGDDVSGVYSSDYRGKPDGSNRPVSNFSLGELDSVELTDTSFAEVRGDFELFDIMMQSGIANYIVSADVNRLVRLLVGDFSPSLKVAVLRALVRNKEGGGEPADIQQALALGRNNMESVFNKFDKLALKEQLRIIAKIDKTKIDKLHETIEASQDMAALLKDLPKEKKKKKKVKEQDTIPRVHGGHRDLTTVTNFIKDFIKNNKGNSVELMFAVMKEFNIEDRRKARDIIKFITTSRVLMGEGGIKQWAMDKYGDDFMNNNLKPKIQYRPNNTRIDRSYDANKHKEAVIQSKMRKQNISRQQAEKQVAMLLRRDPEYFTAKRQMSESVPDNDTITKLKKLMKTPILAKDLKAQMEAYFAIPDPTMIRAFRDARSQGGDNVDLRGIVKTYMKRLHDSQKEKLNISESRGVTARAQGEEYVNKENPEDILTVQEIFVTPEDSNQYETYEDLENALDQIIPQDAVRVNDNNPNSGTKAALIASVTDKNGTPQFWVRFIRAIPPGGVTGLWKTLNGYQFRKGAEQESIPIKPSDLIKDENFKSTSEIEREVMQNLYSQVQDTEHEPLYEIMQQAIDLAKENSNEPIPDAGQYFNVLQKYSGEYLGPIALIDGNSKDGDTQQMLDAYGLETLAGSQVMFPQDTAYALIDSLMKTPDGKEIGVSSKIHTSGGAASSIGGVYKQLTDEIKKKHPKGSKIMEVLATESAINGPIKVCVMLNIISASDAKELIGFDRASQNVDDIQSAKLKQLTLNQGVAQGTLDRPDYRVFFHALTAVAVKMIEAVNEIQDFKDAILESLNNNNYIQILTKGKKVGNDVSLSYYTKFPATYQGEPKLENKNYFATGQKGRIGFKLKK